MPLKCRGVFGWVGTQTWARFFHRPPTPGCACSWPARRPSWPAASLFAVGFARSDWVTGASIHPPAQPVPFSHRHHAGELGIDCRYCHTSVAEGPRAGLPPTHTCMTCHSQIWTGAPMLEPVRASLAAQQVAELESRRGAAGLRVLPPRHPHRQGRRLRRVSRPRRQDGADLSRQAAHHAVLPRLPSRSRRRICGRSTRSPTWPGSRTATARRSATRCCSNTASASARSPIASCVTDDSAVPAPAFRSRRASARRPAAAASDSGRALKS